MFILISMKDAKASKPSPRQRLSQDERRTQTRGHFLEAARTLFARQGFAGTTLDQISEQAGYSRGAFHHNFSSKEDLLLALISACFEADIQTLQRLHNSGQTSQAEEFQAHGESTPFNREYHLLKLEFWLCALRLPRIGEVYAREFAAYRLALARLIQGNTHSELPPEQLAAILVALGNGLDTQRLIDPDAIPTGLYNEALTRFVALKPDG
jgi:AcrR family transcriptional regulator